MRRSMLLTTCFFALAGCTEQVAACPIPGDVRYDDGRCAPPDRPDSGTPPTDARVDPGDGSTCECTGTEICLPDGSCGECAGDDDCTGEVCDADLHECVECATSADCGADRPTCETNACVTGCTRDLCSTNFAGATPACDTVTGGCVVCMPDEFEGVDCMNQSCDASTRTCSGTMLGSLGLCTACARSSECDTLMVGAATASMACVQTFFGTSMESVGSFCLVDSTPAEVRDCPRGTPFAVERAPVDDSTMRTYCTPTTLSTCPAVFDITVCTGTDASVCGVTGLDDATCNTDRCRSHCSRLDPFSCAFEAESCLDRGGAESDFCRRP